MSTGALAERVDTAAADGAIVCPMLRCLTRDGLLPVRRDGAVGLLAAARALHRAGLSWPVTMGLVALAPFANRWRDVPRNLLRASFRVRDMGRGLLVHGADTGILRQGRFDEASFQMLAARSFDGRRLSLSELGEVIALDTWRRPARIGLVLSLAELGAIALLLGEHDLEGESWLPLSSLRSLFEGRLKLAAPRRRVGALRLIRTMARLDRERRKAFRT